MTRRGFLKLLGYSSVALAIPMNLQWFIDKVVSEKVSKDELQEMFGDILKNISQKEMDYLNNLNEEYTLFRLGDGRVRVTKDFDFRVKRLKSSKQVNVVEKTNNIFQASFMEQQYNKQLKKELYGKLSNHKGQPYFWTRVRTIRSQKEDVSIRRKQNTDYDKLNKRKRTLSEKDIIDMKDMYRNNPWVGFPELASMYNVDKVTIHNIMHGLIYKGIGGEVTIRQPKVMCPKCTHKGWMSKGNLTKWHSQCI